MRVVQAYTAIGSSGKTIKSGPEDRVFVYFADHGAPGGRLVVAWLWMRLASNQRAWLACCAAGSNEYALCSQ